MACNDAATDEERYRQWQEARERRWEGLCRRCGACCGVAEGDPCEHLSVAGNGIYGCRIYDDRFGWHKTVSGRPLKCVPIREILHKHWPGDECCGYKQPGGQ